MLLPAVPTAPWVLDKVSTGLVAVSGAQLGNVGDAATHVEAPDTAPVIAAEDDASQNVTAGTAETRVYPTQSPCSPAVTAAEEDSSRYVITYTAAMRVSSTIEAIMSTLLIRLLGPNALITSQHSLGPRNLPHRCAMQCSAQ